VSPRLTYVYCLVVSARRPVISSRVAAHGVPGARDARAVAAGDNLWLIVASVPAAEYDEAALAEGLQDLDWVGRRAMAHETTVEQFLALRAVVPMQLFTLFTSDERALQHVERQRKEIQAVVKRLERKLEWGLRLTFDEQALRDGIERATGSPARGRKSTGTGKQSGTAYLARKRDLLDVHRVRLGAAKLEADRLFTSLSREAADARRRTATEQAAPGSRLLLDAAFLVPVSRTKSFRAAVSRRVKQVGLSDVVVSLTGPWPPYNFIAPGAPKRRVKKRGQDAD
jgi:hypothetical protein